jgi:CRISPR-associated protein (TIGR02584 family)
VSTPSTYPRRALLAVVGLTPQVVTETLWALATRAEAPFLPTELVVVTTAEGRERLLLTLLDEDHGQLRALAEDLGRPELAHVLTPERIHVAGADRPLEDIRTPEDHVVVADLLTRLIGGLTADPACALHVSIAGGRKTMSFLGGYVLSLFARPQDRLSHVLVAQPFESHPQFFFPPRRPQVLLVPPDGRPVRTDHAAVTLAEIPFVRLRERLPPGLLRDGAAFAEAVQAAQAGLDEPELVIDVPTATVTVGGRPIAMQPVQLAFLLALARRCRRQPEGVGWREIGRSEILAAHDDLFRDRISQRERLARTLRNGVERDWWLERRSRHDKLVTAALGWRAAPYRIERVGTRPSSCYRLALPAERIRIIEEASRP